MTGATLRRVAHALPQDRPETCVTLRKGQAITERKRRVSHAVNLLTLLIYPGTQS